MSTNITTAFKSGVCVIVSPQVVSTTDNAGNSISVTLPHVTRILAVHAYSTVAGTFDIGDKNGSKIKRTCRFTMLCRRTNRRLYKIISF